MTDELLGDAPETEGSIDEDEPSRGRGRKVANTTFIECGRLTSG